ncbi:rRNA N6-adenosine-methyltransferase ZCCHC4-like [Xenia sp. Carnegie-2017]|uniref:rRNA N6-adenosine-methyltransferase ZCCHC4-like n=1 Tax=Xenia sp. Carnegie-2017 TaxID=2897299 RepID=UPI001F049862|nr:rRNA N6-adenosine-methyltransferase ZCCHC4-like [Xenia sp. Carnegie-2017]
MYRVSDIFCSFCDKCQQYFSKENLHCDLCNDCPTKHNNVWQHCLICGKCVKKGYVHCEICKSCKPPGHDCQRGDFTLTSFAMLWINKSVIKKVSLANFSLHNLIFEVLFLV